MVEINAGFGNWLDTFVVEKGINTGHVFEVTNETGLIHYVPLGVVLRGCKVTSPEQQRFIRDMLTTIDFRNGNVMDFFEHLAKALVCTNH